MSQRDDALVPVSPLTWLAYWLLKLVWMPVQLAAQLWVLLKLWRSSKQPGVSQSITMSFYVNWQEAVFDFRDDPAVLQLGKAMTHTSVKALFASFFPAWVHWQMTGRHPTLRLPELDKADITDTVPTVNQCFDQLTQRRLPQVQQLVILYAGFDTRAYPERHGIRTFEVDQAAVQQHKLSSIKNADIAHDHVTYVSVDFSQESVLEKLTQAGFDSHKPALFVWDGTSQYHSEETVRLILRELSAGSAAGSVLVVDFYGQRILKWGKSWLAQKLNKLFRIEPFGFGFSFKEDWDTELESFAQSEGCAVGETLFLGSSHKHGPYMVVAELLLENGHNVKEERK